MTDRWKRPRSAWRDDEEFVALATRLWPDDFMWAQRKYDRGAVQRLRHRWEGRAAALAEVAEWLRSCPDLLIDVVSGSDLNLIADRIEKDLKGA
jgi:hypothetical protein